MKIFISQPMNGRTDEQIAKERAKATKRLKEIFKEVEIIDSYVKGENAVECLGKSIQLLSQASLVVFLEGWESARGCRIEKQICEDYNIKNISLQEKAQKKYYDDTYPLYYEKWFF